MPTSSSAAAVARSGDAAIATPAPPCDAQAAELAALRREIAALKAELAERNARWSALYQTAIMFAQRVYSGDILMQIVRHSIALLDVHDAVLLELDAATGELVARVSLARDGPPPVRAGLRVKPGQGITGLALLKGEAQIVDAYHAWPGRLPEVRSTGMQAALAIPLVGRRGIVGVLGVATEAVGRRFSDQDVQTLTLFAQQAAAVLEAAAGRRLERELLVRNERRRLAQELHDGTQQRLAALLLKVDACQAALDETHPEACATLEMVANELQGLMRDTRATVRALYDWELQGRSLDEALRALVEHRAAETGLRIHLAVSQFRPGLLSPQGEAVALRFVREALTNTYKHARASEATVRLELAAGDVRLSVSDNGRGIVAADVWDDGRQAGFGLLSLREQVEALGGRFGLESSPGRGATVWAVIPPMEAIYADPDSDRG